MTKKVTKKTSAVEVITDIKSRYFMDGDVEKVELTYLNKDEVIRTEIKNA